MDYNFVEVMKNFNRMCKKYDYLCDINECPVAQLIDGFEKKDDCIWDRDCVYFGSKYPKEFAEAVMQWAASHEEPIYPTIGEILNKICGLMNIDLKTNINTLYDERINEVVADYFGIQPINKDKLVQ